MGDDPSFLDEAIASQRADWVAGKRVPLSDRIALGIRSGLEAEEIAQVIYQEFLLRDEVGEQPDWTEFLLRFPEHEASLRLLRFADQMLQETSTSLELRTIAEMLTEYEVLEEIGRGGTSCVFKARDKRLDRDVALKILNVPTEERERLLTEACLVARLKHPSIVQIYEISEIAGHQFLALEFLEGPSLASHISGRPLPLSHAVAIAEKLAKAVHYAHQMDIVHCDLKPANVVLVQEAGEWIPKIADFGAARRLNGSQTERPTEIIGTASYMAPEQVASEPNAIDCRTDVYGLGAMLYEMLTGRPPYLSDSPLHTLGMVTEGNLVRPSLLNASIPPDIETICLKCLQLQADRRYQSAQELAEDLSRFVRGQPILARRVGIGERSWRWSRRNPVMTALIATLAFAVLFGVSGIVIQWRRAESALQEAVASDEEAQLILADLVGANAIAPVEDYGPGSSGYGLTPPSMDSLLRAKSHCRNLLLKHPHDLKLRIALTNVCGRLGNLYLQRGERAESETVFEESIQLWNSATPEILDSTDGRHWLATTHYWRGCVAGAFFDHRVCLRAMLKANELWQRVAEDRPNDLEATRRLFQIHRLMKSNLSTRIAFEECRRELEEACQGKSEFARESTADRSQRSHLAMVTLLLADIPVWDQDLSDANSRWKIAYENYQRLVEESPGNLLLEYRLATCCLNLASGDQVSTFYPEGTEHFTKVLAPLEGLLQNHPDVEWLNLFALQVYADLAELHAKAGAESIAEQIYQDQIRPRIDSISQQSFNQESEIQFVGMLYKCARLLQKAQQPKAALTLLRQAAALTASRGAYPNRDVGFRLRLGLDACYLSGALNQAGDASLSLDQALLAKRLFDDCCRNTPNGYERLGNRLSLAWEKIGKARWNLGQQREAILAFQESVAAQRRVYEQDHSFSGNRVLLTRCHDRVIYWAGLCNQWDDVAKALGEIEKLWPDSPEKLLELSAAFEEMSSKLRQGTEKSTVVDAKRADQYLAESRRLSDLAKQISGGDLVRIPGRIRSIW